MRRKSNSSLVAWGVGAAVLAAVIVAAATGLSLVIAYVLACGLVTFAVYGFDKQRAIRRGWRVPEAVLIALSLLGGALGGWAGMLVWRHKTRHVSFWIAQVAGTAVIAATLWLLAE